MRVDLWVMGCVIMGPVGLKAAAGSAFVLMDMKANTVIPESVRPVQMAMETVMVIPMDTLMAMGMGTEMGEMGRSLIPLVTSISLIKLFKLQQK